MVKVLNINYHESETVIAQGKNVSRYEKKGFYKKQGGNGTYRMVKPSTAILVYEVDGKQYSSNVKSLIRETYNINNVAERHVDRFYDDVKSGKISLDYSKESGLFKS